ncbi:unnamed protein product [Caenorhabditis sp. 36 PRJEB53466]|nr:unnamed protein product [Caenorhabditis sp. 36 PRJEB53466]
MSKLPQFGTFVLQAKQRNGATCHNGLPLASPSREMLGRFPYVQNARHANLAQYFRFSESVIARDLVFLVAEHYNDTLTSILRTNSHELSPLSIYTDLLYGLEYLHNRNLVHGQLELDSVYVTWTGNKMMCKMTGFGFPFLTDHGNYAISPNKCDSFLAPEQYLYPTSCSFDATFSMDVWGLGIVLLQVYLKLVLKELMTEDDYVSLLIQNAGDGGSFPRAIINFAELKIGKLTHSLCSYTEGILANIVTVILDDRKDIGYLVQYELDYGVKEVDSKQTITFKSAEELRREVLEEKKNPPHLPLEDVLHIWEMSGSSVETILLKMGVISDVAPIITLPPQLSKSSRGYNSEITGDFDSSIISLPNSRLLSKVANRQQFESESWFSLQSDFKSGKTPTGISNTATLYHLLDALGVGTGKDVVEFLEHHSVLSHQRSTVWRSFLGISETSRTVIRGLDLMSPHESDRQLDVDLPRCHQYDRNMTTPHVQDSLRKIIKGWLLIPGCEHVYWQGCDSLASPFLLTHLDDLETALACFDVFTRRYCHNLFLQDNSSVIKEYLATFYLLLAYVDPALHNHFKITGFEPELFAIPWFLTCFAHVLPLEKLMILWDSVMMNGDNYPLFVGLAMLHWVIHDTASIPIQDVVDRANQYVKIVPQGCSFRLFSNCWSGQKLTGLETFRQNLSNLSLEERLVLPCPQMSIEELTYYLEKSQILVIDTRSTDGIKNNTIPRSIKMDEATSQEEIFYVFRGVEYENYVSDVSLERKVRIARALDANSPKVLIYNADSFATATKTAEKLVRLGVTSVCLLAKPFEIVNI